MTPHQEYNQTLVKALVPCSHDQLLAFKVIILFFAAFMTANKSANKGRKAQWGSHPFSSGLTNKRRGITALISFEFIIINREGTILMSYINIKGLKKLIQGLDYSERLKNMVKKYEVQYNTKLLLEDFQNLVDLASKINNREKTKTKKQEDGKANPKAESFSYGEFKLFAWTLILYSLAEKLQLPDMKTQHFDDISKIFRNKSMDFIEYQVKCLISSKEKSCRCWGQAELQMLTTIISENNTVDWKIISYILFKTSEKKYYRPPHHCREKWVNCINPTIKKGDWTLQEDIEIFQLINLYGCRWALLSRELMGKRSEHAIKNRYNSVVKTMRKQYKITNNQDLEVKVLKYLKFKESKRVCKGQLLNSSNDSKESRERSREVKEVNQSESQKSMEVNANTATLFDDVFDVGMQFKAAETEEVYVKKVETVELSECWLEEKKEKRTWEEDYESNNGEISLNGTDNFWTDSLQDQISSEKYSKISGLYTDQSYRFFGSSAFDSQDIYQNMKEVGADIQSALGSVHYEKIMNDEWLFNDSWEQ